MPRTELEHEIDDGDVFWGYEEDGELIGVMGIQELRDVTLIGHAYVRTSAPGQGIWKIPQCQIKASVVLASREWLDRTRLQVMDSQPARL